jgi:hypothetical protein
VVQLKKNWLDLKIFRWTTYSGKSSIGQILVEKSDYKKLNKNPSFRDILQFYTEDRILSKTTFLDLGLPTVSTTIPHG